MQGPITDEREIYLDYAAAAPLLPTAYHAMAPYLSTYSGNPSALYRSGRRAGDALQKARTTIATTLGIQDTEIIFTSGGTESDNLAILGLARANRRRGNHIIVSSIEHKAVLAAVHILEQEGFRVTYLPVGRLGIVSPETLKMALTDETVLISIMYANNEIGTVEPIRALTSVLDVRYEHAHRPIFHTDACQAPGMLPIRPHVLGVDAMTLNSTKIGGPKGAGLLYLRSGTDIAPLQVGGVQEFGRRAGTENVAAIVGFSVALEQVVCEQATMAVQLRELQSHFIEKVQKTVPNAIYNGHPTHRLPNNVHISIPDVEGESLVLMLDAHGIAAATGSACSSRDLLPSHVLRAIGQNNEIIHGSLRFTFGTKTTKTDLDFTAKILGSIVERLRNMTASTYTSYENKT